MAAALPTDLDQVFGVYWTLKKQRIGFLRDFVHKAQLLAFTPRTERQRAEMAVKAGELVLEKIPTFGMEEVLGALVLEIVVKPFERVERDQKKFAFHTLKHRYFEYCLKKLYLHRAGKRLNELPYTKLLLHLSTAFQRLSELSLKKRWTQLEPRLGHLLIKTSSICSRAFTLQQQEALRDVAQTASISAIRKMNVVGRKLGRRLGLLVLQLIITYNHGRRPINSQALHSMCLILTKHLFARFRTAKTKIYHYFSITRLAAIANYKIFERKTATFHRLSTRFSSKKTVNRSFLTLNRALKTIPGLSKPYAKAIAEGKSTPQTIAVNDTRNTAIKLVFELAMRKLVAKRHKFLQFEKIAALETIKNWPKSWKMARKVAILIERIVRSKVGWMERTTISLMFREKERPMIRKKGKLTCFCLAINKGNKRKRRSYQKSAIGVWKRHKKTAQIQEKTNKIRSKSAFSIGFSLKSLIKARFRTFQTKSVSLPSLSLTKLFQKLIQTVLGRVLKSIKPNIRTVEYIKSAVFTTVPGLIRVRNQIQMRVVFKSYQKLLKFTRYRSKIVSKRTSKQLFSIYKAENIVKKMVNHRLFKGFFRFASNVLTSKGELKRLVALMGIYRMKSVKWTRLDEKIGRMAMVLGLNHRLAVENSFKTWVSRRIYVKKTMNLGEKHALKLEKIAIRREKYGFCQIKSVFEKKKAVFRLNLTLISAETVRDRASLKEFYQSLSDHSQNRSNRALRLTALLPIAQKYTENRSFSQWKSFSVQKSVFSRKMTQKLNSFGRILSGNVYYLASEAIVKISAKARVRRLLPIHVFDIISKKVAIIESISLLYLQNSKEIFAKPTSTKLISAVKSASVIKSMNLRLIRDRIGTVFTEYRFGAYNKSMACRRIVASLGRTRKRLFGGCFQRISLESAKEDCCGNGKMTDLVVNFSPERADLYRFLQILADLPKKIDLALLSTGFDRFSENVESERVRMRKRYNKLAALKAVFVSRRSVAENPSLRFYLSIWKLSTFNRETVTFAQRSKLVSALKVVQRFASYRLYFQAFEAIYSSSQLKDISHGVVLCKKATLRSNIKRLSKCLRLDYERTASILGVAARVRDNGWKSTLETGSGRSSPELAGMQESAKTAYFPVVGESRIKRLGMSPIPDMQPSPQPKKPSLDHRKSPFQSQTPSVRIGSPPLLPFASPTHSELRLEAMPLYSSPYYPYKSFMTLQLEGSFSDRGGTPLSTRSNKRF